MLAVEDPISAASDVHRPLTLGEQIEEFQPMRTGQRLAESRELAVETVFELPVLGGASLLQ